MESVSIKWQMPVDLDGVLVPHCTDAVHLPEKKQLPFILIEDHDQSTYSFSHFHYLEVDSLEKAFCSNIGLAETEGISTISLGSGSITQHYIPTFRLNGNTYEKLMSFVVNKETAIRTAITLEKPSSTKDTVTESVLNNGAWYKVQVYGNGIYKLDYAFLESIGISPSSIDPRNLAVYGNGGAMLPQSNSAERAYDLEENSILGIGEDDGSFDEGDYFLFYGQGPNELNYDANQDAFSHQINYYSTSNYYFITVKDSPGQRIENSTDAGTGGVPASSFDEYTYHELESTKLVISGRSWTGESFEYDNDHSIQLSIPEALDSILFTLQCVSQSKTDSTYYNLAINNITQDRLAVRSSTSNTYGIKGRTGYREYVLDKSQVGSSASAYVTFDENGNNDALGYIDFFSARYNRQLNYTSGSKDFRKAANLLSDIQYEIPTSNSSLVVWNVTDPTEAQKMTLDFQNDTASFHSSAGAMKEYIMFTGSNFNAPSFVSEIPNQNLHGLATPDYIIITHPYFTEAAEKLADYRRSHNGFDVEVQTTGNIYNEFSSGRPDVTALRDFVRMLYQNDTDKLKYLLLLGDASYDYKNILDDNTNFVPTYQSRESLHNVNTYCSDDFYGFMNDDEGEWVESSAGNHTMEIGIGRFPINTNEEAEIAIDKIIHYETDPDCYGKWRNEICFVADDGDGILHMEQADELSVDYIESGYPNYNSYKLFLDSYEQESGASGEISPVATTELNSQVSEGALIVNYTGHGGETGWAQEQLLTIPQYDEWDNLDNMPLFVTATCEFGRNDDPERESGAEVLFKKTNGGAIALLSTTRPVYSSSNFKISKEFYSYALEPNSDGSMPALGDIIRQSKNGSLTSVFNRNFTLLGDPAIVLAYPENKVVITHINNDTLGAIGDTIGALAQITFHGQIQDLNDELISGFNGTLDMRVYDKQNSVTTLGNERLTFTYDDYNSILFEGSASVVDGAFEITFVVPKDISYNLDAGKISLYAHNALNQDAAGSYLNIIIGGSATSFDIDDTPPEAELFMDDLSFIDGGLTGESPLFIALLEDDHGINTATSGIGHEITLVIDDDQQNKLILNDFYTANLDDFTSGRIDYGLNNLEEGLHTATLKAWDTYNNSVEESITFYVGSEPEIVAYPIPVTRDVTFSIDHTRPNEEMVLNLRIMDARGVDVAYMNTTVPYPETHLESFTWDGTQNGVTLANGTYFYAITVRYTSDESSFTTLGRIVLLK